MPDAKRRRDTEAVMARVLFTEEDEFLGELERDARAGAVQDGIIRVTRRCKRVESCPTLTHLSVVATYVARAQVITLERPMGTLWGFEDQDTPILEKADQLVNRITSAAERLGLEVRAGMILPD
jgi:hypothetical protein